MINIMKELL